MEIRNQIENSQLFNEKKTMEKRATQSFFSFIWLISKMEFHMFLNVTFFALKLYYHDIAAFVKSPTPFIILLKVFEFFLIVGRAYYL